MAKISGVSNLLKKANTWLAENIFSSKATFNNGVDINTGAANVNGALNVAGTANFTGEVQVSGAAAKMVIYNEGTLACSADSLRNVSHGLGAKPDHVELWLECTTADDGYSVGEQIPVGGSVTAGTSNGGISCVIRANETQFRIVQALYLYGIRLTGTGQFNVQTLNQANWQIRWKAWRYV